MHSGNLEGLYCEAQKGLAHQLQISRHALTDEKIELCGFGGA
jgi:hypothetical protein